MQMTLKCDENVNKTQEILTYIFYENFDFPDLK